MLKSAPLIIAAILALLVQFAGTGCAGAEPSPATLAESYVQSDGFAPVDAEALTEAINDGFAGPAPPESIRLPSADVDALTMSVLSLELRAPELRHARYRITRRVASLPASPAGARAAYSFIEVTRFSLGKAVREELAGIHGAEKVGPPDAFPQAPHVAWRLVTRPLMGNRAAIIAAGRRTLSEEAAAGAQCFDQPCLTPGSVIDEAVPWGPMDSMTPETGLLQPASETGALTPASVSSLLVGLLPPPEAGAASPGAVADLEIGTTALIETGLGQDAGVEAAAQQGQMDDSVLAVWQRVAALGGAASLFEAVAYECARGPAFAEPGAYCP